MYLLIVQTEKEVELVEKEKTIMGQEGAVPQPPE